MRDKKGRFCKSQEKVYATGIKGFLPGMICKPDNVAKQYAENTVFEEKGGRICGAGVMHAAEDAATVLEHFNLLDNNADFCEFAPVEALAEVQKDGSKWATSKLRIGAKFSFGGFISAMVECIIEKTKKRTKNSSGYLAKIGSSGYLAKIGSSGDRAQIGSSGDLAQIGSSGDRAQIGSSGDEAQIGSSGDLAKIGSSGDRAQIGSSGYLAKIGSSGDLAQIGSSGDEAKIGSSGDGAVISAIGKNSAVKGKKGSWIVLAEYNVEGKPACVKAAQIDGEKLKENVFYKLENGEFVELGK